MPAAFYPNRIKTFSNHADYVDVIYAAHPNDIQAEVTAIEAELGVNPSAGFSTVSGRIADLEGKYFPKTGGSFTGAVDMGGNALSGLPVPSTSSAAATKSYVDSSTSSAQSSAEMSGIVSALLFAGI